MSNKQPPREFRVWFDEDKGCFFAEGVVSGLPKEGVKVVEKSAYDELQEQLRLANRRNEKYPRIVQRIADGFDKQRDTLQAELDEVTQMLEHKLLTERKLKQEIGQIAQRLERAESLLKQAGDDFVPSYSELNTKIYKYFAEFEK